MDEEFQPEAPQCKPPECTNQSDSAGPAETARKERNALCNLLVRENFPLLKELGVPTPWVGKNEIPVARFDRYNVTPEEYLAELIRVIDSPEDVRLLISKPYMEYGSRKENALPQNEFETIQSQYSDCDERSWLAKVMLDGLGKKNGHNYKARVIGMGTHAVCIFQDKDNKYYSINQGAKIKEFKDISEASEIFSEILYKDPNVALHEVRHHKEGHMLIPLDKKTLEPTYTTLGIAGATNDKDLAKILPKDWKQYETVVVKFKDGSLKLYKKGVFTLQKLPDDSAVDPINGVIMRKLPNGITISNTIFKNTLKTTYEGMLIQDVPRDQKIEDILPKDWKRYKELEIHFKDYSYQLYRKGKKIRVFEI